MKYFIVVCKCGHLGRNRYIPISFPIEAFDGKEAAAIARTLPRVKRNHKYAILSCQEVSKERYLEQNTLNNQDPYLLCHSRHEQNKIFHSIKDRVCFEDESTKECRITYRNSKPNLLVQSIKYFNSVILREVVEF